MQKLIVNSILKQVSDNDKPSLIVSYGGTSILNTSVVRPIYFTATSKYPNIEKTMLCMVLQHLYLHHILVLLVLKLGFSNEKYKYNNNDTVIQYHYFNSS